MKKFTTKLLMSIIAVAFAFVALGTSTYAWFSMNTQVSVTSMEVNAKSNATYLLIDNVDNATVKTTSADTKTAAYLNGDSTNTTTYNEEKKVYPAAYTTTAITDGAETPTTLVPANNWYTASNRNSNNATNAITNQHVVTEGDKDYMLTYKCWLTLSEDSEATSAWKIKATFSLASGDAATSVCVKIGSDTFFLNSTNTNGTTAAAVALAPTTSVEVTIYVYIDGNSTNVYSDYINGGNQITGNATVTFDLVDANA